MKRQPKTHGNSLAHRALGGMGGCQVRSHDFCFALQSQGWQSKFFSLESVFDWLSAQLFLIRARFRLDSDDKVNAPPHRIACRTLAGCCLGSGCLAAWATPT
jgi:hypothetical protein